MQPARTRRRVPSGIKFSRPFQILLLGIIGTLVLTLAAFGFKMRHSLWDDQLPLTLVVAGPEKLAVFQVSKAETRAVLLKLPGNLLVGVAGVGSEYQAKSLWRFGEIEGRAGEITGSSVAAFLGIWVDGYIFDPSWQGGFPLSWSRLLGKGVITNLNWYDRLKTTATLAGLRSDQKVELELPANLAKGESAPDGYEVVRVDRERLPVVIGQYFSSNLISADRRTLRVANGSGSPGMARLLERMIVSSGGAVVEIEEAPLADNWCKARYKGELTGIVRWLKKRLDCELETVTDLGRADVEVILGSKFGERFSR